MLRTSNEIVELDPTGADATRVSSARNGCTASYCPSTIDTVPFSNSPDDVDDDVGFAGEVVDVHGTVWANRGDDEVRHGLAGHEVETRGVGEW